MRNKTPEPTEHEDLKNVISELRDISTQLKITSALLEQQIDELKGDHKGGK